MKKLLVAVSLVMAAALAQADVTWSWWLENPSAKPEVSFGLASKCQSVEALEMSLFYSASPVEDGLQFTWFGLNNSDSTCPLQLAFFNRGKDPCVQLGFINVSKSSVFDLGFANMADDAKFQLGFLNFNKKGFLPVCVLVNFDPEIFE